MALVCPHQMPTKEPARASIKKGPSKPRASVGRLQRRGSAGQHLAGQNVQGHDEQHNASKFQQDAAIRIRQVSQRGEGDGEGGRIAEAVDVLPGT